MSSPTRSDDLGDPLACARWLVAAIRHMDTHAREGVGVVRVGPDDDGRVHVSIDPTRDTPFPSNNPNRAMVIAGGTGLDGALVGNVVAAFRSAGLARFFVWVMPGSRAEEVEGVLVSRGLTRFRGPDYIVLARPASGPVAGATGLEVRRLSSADVRMHARALGEALEQPRLESFLMRTADRSEFVHFGVFDGERPVACASSMLLDGQAYLGWAATGPGYRGRGAQSALIAARVRHAQESGCGWCVSETVSLGRTSLGNLVRCGFTVSQMATVYQWGS